MRDKRYGVNGRQRPLIPIPVEDVPEATQCVQLTIPDGDAAIRQLIGMVNLLGFWTSYEREASHAGAAWAKAWRDALSVQIPGECVVQTQIRADDICTLSWSYDDWATFDSYDPSACITANIDSVVPGMIAQGILDAIEDGLIQRPGGVQSPQSAPEPGECRTYHVTLDADDTWPCPSPVSSGDTVQILNATGAWNDGSGFGAIGPWRCPDGGEYGLGVCGGGQITEAGDPLPTSYHMIPIGHIGSTFFDPATIYTIPSGHTNAILEFQANDSSLSDNLGGIEFDVEICTGTWCYEFNFLTGQQGWTIPTFSGTAHAVYTAGSGFQHNVTPCRARITIDITFTSVHLTSIEVIRTGSTSNIGVWIQGTDGTNLGNTGFGAPLDSTVSLDVTRTNLRVDVRGNGDCNGTNVDGFLQKIRLRGVGLNPFGSSNC